MTRHRKLKTPMAHLTNNMSFTVELDRIEALAYEVLITRSMEIDWNLLDAQTDATMLMLLVNGLVEDVHRLNDERNHLRAECGQDQLYLCPRCASHTWSRPMTGGKTQSMDFTKRECSRCKHVYPDPEHDDE